MDVRRLGSAVEVAEAAAQFVAGRAREAIGERLRFTMALSGGSTPWEMLKALTAHSLPWECVHIFQVDERQAPDGDADRNLTHIKSQFTDPVGLAADHLYPMPVNEEPFEDGARAYEQSLAHVAGKPAVLDLVHLGLGSDGHTASILPGDALMGEAMADVGTTPPYQGHRRMSLTYPAIDRARNILWLVNGADKAGMLERLISGDVSIPAGHVRQTRAVVFTDIKSGGE